MVFSQWKCGYTSNSVNKKGFMSFGETLQLARVATRNQKDSIYGWDCCSGIHLDSEYEIVIYLDYAQPFNIARTTTKNTSIQTIDRNTTG